jgi:hypothetical protein
MWMVVLPYFKKRENVVTSFKKQIDEEYYAKNSTRVSSQRNHCKSGLNVEFNPFVPNKKYQSGFKNTLSFENFDRISPYKHAFDSQLHFAKQTIANDSKYISHNVVKHERNKKSLTSQKLEPIKQSEIDKLIHKKNQEKHYSSNFQNHLPKQKENFKSQSDSESTYTRKYNQDLKKGQPYDADIAVQSEIIFESKIPNKNNEKCTESESYIKSSSNNNKKKEVYTQHLSAKSSFERLKVKPIRKQKKPLVEKTMQNEIEKPLRLESSTDDSKTQKSSPRFESDYVESAINIESTNHNDNQKPQQLMMSSDENHLQTKSSITFENNLMPEPKSVTQNTDLKKTKEKKKKKKERSRKSVDKNSEADLATNKNTLNTNEMEKVNGKHQKTISNADLSETYEETFKSESTAISIQNKSKTVRLDTGKTDDLQKPKQLENETHTPATVENDQQKTIGPANLNHKLKQTNKNNGFSDDSIKKTELKIKKLKKMKGEKGKNSANKVRLTVEETKTVDQESQTKLGFIPKNLEDVLENIQKRMTKLEEIINTEEQTKPEKSKENDTSNESSDGMALKKSKINGGSKNDQTNKQKSGSQQNIDDKLVYAKKELIHSSTSPVFANSSLQNGSFAHQRSNAIRKPISPLPAPIVDDIGFSTIKDNQNEDSDEYQYADYYSPRFPSPLLIRVFDTQ